MEKTDKGNVVIQQETSLLMPLFTVEATWRFPETVIGENGRLVQKADGNFLLQVKNPFQDTVIDKPCLVSHDEKLWFISDNVAKASELLNRVTSLADGFNKCMAFIWQRFTGQNDAKCLKSESTAVFNRTIEFTAADFRIFTSTTDRKRSIETIETTLTVLSAFKILFFDVEGAAKSIRFGEYQEPEKKEGHPTIYRFTFKEGLLNWLRTSGKKKQGAKPLSIPFDIIDIKPTESMIAYRLALLLLAQQNNGIYNNGIGGKPKTIEDTPHLFKCLPFNHWQTTDKKKWQNINHSRLVKKPLIQALKVIGKHGISNFQILQGKKRISLEEFEALPLDLFKQAKIILPNKRGGQKK